MMQLLQKNSKLTVIFFAVLLGLGACQTMPLSPADEELFKDSEK